MTETSLRAALKSILSRALNSVDGEAVVLSRLHLRDNCLQAGPHRIPLNSRQRIFLVGAGKAAVAMARAVESILGERLMAGLVVVKEGHGGRLNRTRVLEASHPEPDERGFRAALEMLDFLEQNLTEGDLLLVLLSGGGSALLPAPVEGLSLQDKQRTTAALLKCGATIQELNTLRKHLSRIKGGRLLEHTRSATVLTLLLSDVVGDDLSSIASGPTAPDPTRYEDCLEIIRRYGLEKDLPPAVVDRLQRGGKETLKPGDPCFERVHHLIVGSNIQALQAGAEQAQRLGYRPLILSSTIEGNTRDIAGVHVAIARQIFETREPVAPPCCLISGGETTVVVAGDGTGGRNMEFVLWCARAVQEWGDRPVLFASIGSDGTDGPTDAAGAEASPRTVARALRLGLSVDDHLRRNDSYPFFRALDDLIVTGPTQTNVMDLRFVLIG